MNLISAQQDKIEMTLKQMGANIKSIHGILSYVKIMVGDTEITYVYNINTKNQFFLQRVTPYPLGAGIFNNQNEVLAYIKKDIESFTNAYNSSVFNKFTELAYRTHRTTHELEEVFLAYNVPMDRMIRIEALLDKVKEELDDICQNCEAIQIQKNED